MTDTIPQDILERAREIAKDWIYNAKETDQLDDFIAQALLAERKAQGEEDGQLGNMTATTTTGTHAVDVRYTPKSWGVEIDGVWLDLGADKARADRIAAWLNYGYQALELGKPAAAIRNQP